ncbi:hypothetical protein RRG08_051198 [Elysia crispata]|uniref:Uncharacterized protein n=1 Tax=Elysia crispata TaxID=231223 RepID=A0AAE0Z846_9GAST|nr:hypothetical protein RRG08_051198 [Elysia crispata]
MFRLLVLFLCINKVLDEGFKDLKTPIEMKEIKEMLKVKEEKVNSTSRAKKRLQLLSSLMCVFTVPFIRAEWLMHWDLTMVRHKPSSKPLVASGDERSAVPVFSRL